MLCPIKVNSNTIKPTVHTSCYCVLDLLCVTIAGHKINPKTIKLNLKKSQQHKETKSICWCIAKTLFYKECALSSDERIIKLTQMTFCDIC